MRIIYSGGGTGGHIFPAVAVAQEMKKRYPESEVLFIGAKGKMEMTKVPNAGFIIKGLWISGFHRSLTFRNILFPIKLLVSLVSAYGILRKFKPDVIAGFGGYASGAALWVAAKMGIPSLIMEQNSYPGMTNKLLNGSADLACLAYEETSKFFDKTKVMITGNPIREGLVTELSQLECKSHLGLDTAKWTILIVGGSLGARSINAAMSENLELIKKLDNVQIIWQCGAGYIEAYKDSDVAQLDHVHISAFIDDMSIAYGAADVVICRSGALTLAELMYIGKAAILIPSPNVAEDHQTSNAKALASKDAAILLPDSKVSEMIDVTVSLLNDDERRRSIEKNVNKMAHPNAVKDIADGLESIVRK